MKKQLSLLLTLALLFYCLDFFFRISQSIIVTQLMQQYTTDTLGIGGFASAFYIGYAIMQIPSGLILDSLNFNRVFALSIVLCALCFIGFTQSTMYVMGYIFRFLIGMTSAFSFISVLYLARRYFAPHNFSFIAGIAIAAGTLAAASVQSIGTCLINYFSWHSVFSGFALLAVLIGLIILLPALKLIEKNGQESSKLKLSSAKTQIINIIKTPIIIRNAIIGSLFYLPTTIFASLWGIPFLQYHYGFSKQAASFGIMIIFLGWAIGSPILGYRSRYSNFSYLYILIGAVIGFITSIILIYFTSSSFLVWLLLLIFGLASSAQSMVWKIFDNHCPKEFQGFAISYTNMIIMISGAIFHIVVGYLLSANIIVNSQNHINYAIGLAIIPISFFLVAILSLTLRNTD